MSNSKSRELAQPEGRFDEYVQQYALRRPLQEEFTSRLLALVKSLLESLGLEVHLIENRTKDIQSFRDKISRASKKYRDPLNEITDLTGIRVIAYYEEDVDKVCTLIEDEFDIDRDNSLDRRSGVRPDEFGYQAVHYVVKLSESRRTLSEWHPFVEFKAEIQVRTVLQHAWAAISHKLQYKRESDIPDVLRRKLFRLSALLELADDEFMAIRDRTLALTQDIEQRLSKGDRNVDIDLVALDEFLRTSEEVTRLHKQAVSAGFKYDFEDAADSISDLVSLCNHFRLKSISQLEDALRSSTDWSRQYLKSQIAPSKTEWYATDAFICKLILIKVFRTVVDVQHLLEQGWDEEIASRVLGVASK